MHRYRTHRCGELAKGQVASTARLSGWVHRKRDHGQLLFIDLRDHYRHHPGRLPARDGDLRRGGGAAAGKRDHRHRRGRRPHRRDREPRSADRRDRDRGRCDDRGIHGRHPAAAGQCRARLSRGDPPHATASSISGGRRCSGNILLRSAVIGQHSPADDGAGLHRVPDPDPDRQLARRRPRLPGAVAHASRQVLRAAAGAAAIQAAADGVGLRSLLPDRALLSRRGRPRRPLARASSTSSTSRCRSRRKRTCSARSST